MLPGLRTIIAFSALKWFQRLGGPGLILVGLADNSVIPLPGSMDVLTILLAASHREWWFYYSFMATVGAVIGGYLTYHLGSKGGKEMLEQRFPKERVEKLYKKFEEKDFWTVTVPAMLPPPVPIVPFLLAAGALQYSRRRFIASLALGRAIRFTVIGFVSAHYGPAIFRFFSKYYKPALYTLIALAIAGGVAGVIVYVRHNRKTDQWRNPKRRTAKRKVA